MKFGISGFTYQTWENNEKTLGSHKHKQEMSYRNWYILGDLARVHSPPIHIAGHQDYHNFSIVPPFAFTVLFQWGIPQHVPNKQGWTGMIGNSINAGDCSRCPKQRIRPDSESIEWANGTLIIVVPGLVNIQKAFENGHRNSELFH